MAKFNGQLPSYYLTWSHFTGTPTTAAGYGITNGATIDLWGAKTPPSGSVVGTSDTQTLTNKSIAASEVNSGTLSISQIPTGTSSTTVALGNAPSAAQAAAISAAEANAAGLYVPLSGGTAITGDIGANGGSNWVVHADGTFSLANGNITSDVYGDFVSLGSIETTGAISGSQGVFDGGAATVGNNDGSGIASFANGAVTIDPSGDQSLAGVINGSGLWANPTTRIIYDQYSEQAFSSVSDSYNTDNTTTLISDPDYGYVAVNGYLFARAGIQIQPFGGSSVTYLNGDGSAIFAGGAAQIDTSGNVAVNTLTDVNGNAFSSLFDGSGGNVLNANYDASSGQPLSSLFDGSGGNMAYAASAGTTDTSYAYSASTDASSGNPLSSLFDGSGGNVDHANYADNAGSASSADSTSYAENADNASCADEAGGTATADYAESAGSSSATGKTLYGTDGSESGIAVFTSDGSTTAAIDDSTTPTNGVTRAGWLHVQVGGSDAWLDYYR